MNYPLSGDESLGPNRPGPLRQEVRFPPTGQLRSTVPWSALLLALVLPVYALARDQTLISRVIYIVPFVLFAECYYQGRFALHRWIWPALGLIVFSSGLGVLISGGPHREMLFISLSILCLALTFRTTKLEIAELVWSGVAIFATMAAISETPLSNLGGEFTVEAVKGSLELSIGLALGLVALAAYHIRMRGLFLISSGLVFLSGKRIALAALIVALLVDFVMRNPWWNRRQVRWAVGISLAAISCLVGIFAASFYENLSYYLRSWFHLAVSADYLSAGRYDALRAVDRYLAASQNIFFEIAGRGIGFTTRSMEASLGTRIFSNYPLLHDDWLRIQIDFGIIGVLGVIYAFGKLSSLSRLGLSFAVYTSVMFITDNVLTYLSYWLIFAICVNVHWKRGGGRHRPIQRPPLTRPSEATALRNQKQGPHPLREGRR